MVDDFLPLFVVAPFMGLPLRGGETYYRLTAINDCWARFIAIHLSAANRRRQIDQLQT